MKFLAGILMFFLAIPAFAAEYTQEQKDFCSLLQKAWGKECSTFYKKEKLNVPKKVSVLMGCEGPGYATHYNRRTGNCKDGADIVQEQYNEVWKNVDKGITERVYWNNGNYVYTSYTDPKRFNGGTITLGNKELKVKEYMGVNRTSHLQEMVERNKKK